MARLARTGPGILSFLLLSGMGSGCADELPGTLRVVIRTELSAPDQMDEIRITVTGSRTPEGNVCEPWTRRKELAGPADLPVTLSIEIGSEYREWVAYRIEGRLRAETVFLRESRVAFPSSGVLEVPVDLEASCYRPTCSGASQCVQGTCVGIPFPGIFDDLGFRDVGVPCDRLAFPEDAGTSDDAAAWDGEGPDSTPD